MVEMCPRRSIDPWPLLLCNFGVWGVGMFYRKCMLVIDGKYKNDDGLSIGRMCQESTRSLLGRQCRARSTRSKYATMDLIEDFLMNVKFEPKV
jgi:hypothetical protein